MGWKLTMSGGQPVIPINGAFIVTDDRADNWIVTQQPDSGQWEVTGYNTDIYDHTVYLDFFLDLVGQAATVTTLASNEALSSPAPITTPPPITTPVPVTTPPSSPPAATAPQPLTRPAVSAVPAVTPTGIAVLHG
jgi:hypothetical protein